ncbi:MAG: HlyD family efflux transporter periplasmic adaptor subunit [Phenylobacterium sp.]|uniref:HlyD family secretion protein n=1 Tax=Phenylobacterium sp. TaxID=1871053 RepID=UPI0025F97E58|nr:HlyD family secretion protein [Phenylobacterium sp.]MBI1198758.1 HlyD family efflux transporter periplasmic adaptor subunit [Phenylobacterium sp.]
MSDPDANAAHLPPPRSGLRRWRWPLIIGGPVVIVVVVVAIMMLNARYETTDNAYVQVAKTPVAPSISGRVLEIYVKENQAVRRGQPLFKLDPRDFQATADAAKAQLAAAELQVRADRAAYGQAQANVGAAQEQLAYAEREAKRQRDLAAAGVASRQQVDQAVHAAQQARDELAAARQASTRALAALGGDPNLAAADHPAVMQARAQLERATLDVSYAIVVAPADGVVARVDQLPAGAYLNASQTAFWLLSGKPWIEANFKEDQLAHMKVGQPVSIEIDADPDADLHGRVASFAPGAGSAFSPLPAQNATGNWVKVTQRLPVRIEFDSPPPPMASRAGLSAKVKVDVKAPGRDG